MFRIIIILVGLTLFEADTTAQQKDSMDIIRQFIKVGSSFKEQPLYLVMEYTSTSNLITEPEDSTFLKASFYLQPHGSYMHFGEIEEIVNDSMALLISDKMQRMMLYRNAQPVLAQMRSAIGMQVPKSSVIEWCQKFETYKRSGGGIEYIELIGRSKIYGTSVPKEEMKMLYNQENIPIEITNIKRTLLPIDETSYAIYKTNPAFSDKIVSIDEQHYVIKEQKLQFKYLSIDHLIKELPVIMENRITIDKGLNANKYIPAKGFEKFELTEE